MGDAMLQTAPYPKALAEMVKKLKYRPGWQCWLADMERDPGSSGLTLVITTCGYDSYHPDRGETYRVRHYFPVPPATYNEQSWKRWLFEMHLLVERHEACEFFDVDGDRPYATNHGPGWDPYIVTVTTTELDRRTRFTGEVLAPVTSP